MQASDDVELPLESAQMKEVAEMLKDICKVRAQNLGEGHANVAEAACAIALLFICLKDSLQAAQALQQAQHVLTQQQLTSQHDLMLRTAQAGMQLVHQPYSQSSPHPPL